mmetsp:Transcript_127376/g.317953  ORF Transcript_127376/g.317953 Transcript_127376/m.317953 type:complete len:511 (-) Transcript_127376:68-1600(-)
MAVPLSTASLASLSIPGPAYDRKQVIPGVVHIGVGGFHRAHQAMYTDAVLASQEEGSSQWGISGVGLLPSDARMRDMMLKQDCLYTLWARGATSELRVLGPHCEFLFAPEQHEEVIARLAAQDTKVVTLTITEKGYCSELSTGALDVTLAAVQTDLRAIAAGETCLSTALGFLAVAAQRRMSSNAPGLAVLSCDNVQENGNKLARCALQFAELAGGPELRAYMEEMWTFPNSMVDRITPVTTDALREAVRQTGGVEDLWPVICEDFIQWVVENKFPAGRPPWDKVLGGTCLFVQDVLPYELMKLRLLNGSHQAVAYCGILAGFRVVDEAMADPAIHKYITAYMDAVGQSVPDVPGVDVICYKSKLRQRFSNQAIKDQLLRLTEDSRNRIQVACMPCLSEMRSGSRVPISALLACWLRYLANCQDEHGASFERSVDIARGDLEPLAVDAWAACTSAGPAASGDAAVVRFLDAAFPGGSENVLDLAPDIARLLRVISAQGVRDALEDASKPA